MRGGERIAGSGAGAAGGGGFPRIRMIATDLDGTLLREDKTVSERTVTALRRAREMGVKVIYATARGKSADEKVRREWVDGRATMNGALAFAGEREVYRRLVPVDAAFAFLRAGEARGLKVSAERDGIHYTNFDPNAVWNDRIYAYRPLSELCLEAEKLFAVVRDEDDVRYLAAHVPQGQYMTVSRDLLAQVMHWEATKSNAVAAIAAAWGIDMGEVAAFGDDLNDIDMLRACGVGVAMGNAVEPVRAAADAFCGTNEDDGLAIWVMRNVVGEGESGESGR